jgi:hypothetical protein
VEFLLNDAKKPKEQQVAGSIEYRSKGGLVIKAKSISWELAKKETLLERLGTQVVFSSVQFKDTSSIEELKNLFVKAKEQLDAIK